MAAQGQASHRIRKVTFDFHFQEESQAFQARQRLQEVFYHTIVPLLQEAFDAYSPNGQVIRIDRLEIDLGFLDAALLLDGDLIRQLIRHQLNRRLANLSAPKVEKLPLQVSLEQSILRFLETGCWPWYLVHRSIEELEAGWRTLMPAESRRLLQRLWPLLRRRQVRLRLIYQFSPWFYEAVIDTLPPDTVAKLRRLRKTVLRDLDETAAREINLAVAADIALDKPLPAQALEDRVRREASRLPVSEAEPEPGITDRDQWGDLPAETVRGASKPVPAESQEEAQQEAPIEETLYLRHAGVVLLHPFLPRFFDRLGLLADSTRFAGAAAQVRAIHVLHFLATGEVSPEESETLLFKVLCGFPVGAPVPKYLPLSPPEKEEAQDLLAAAIGHWQKLKSTSPAGLREAFLQREGKLTREKVGWRLAVEPHAVDVLLDYLPWSLSPVRLPCMDLPLHVDWA